MPWPWVQAWLRSNVRRLSSALHIVCSSSAITRKPQSPMRNFLQPMPTTRGRWKPATGSANASWPPAGCHNRERPGGNY